MKPQNARLAMVLGVSQLAQGAVMVLAPAWFYAVVPGVDETGPFNSHLMRDVGCAFLLAGACLALFAARRRFAAAGAAGAGYLVLHALMHVWDGVAGRERAVHLAHDLPLLLGLAAAALWAVWPETRALCVAKD
jgi:peptidoglycan/LPS O-acetylase OafA/YrhL